MGADGKNRLKLRHKLEMLLILERVHEVIIRKCCTIKTVYSKTRRFVGTCKEAVCPWYVAGAKLNNGTGFILREYN